MFKSLCLTALKKTLPMFVVMGSVCASNLAMASSPIVHMAPVKRHFTTVYQPETAQQFFHRMQQIKRSVHDYHLDLSDVYVFIGKEKQNVIGSKRFGKGAVTVGRMTTPSYFANLYRRGHSQNQFVYLNKKTGHARVFRLSPDDVKPLTAFTSAHEQVLTANIHQKSAADQAQVLAFAQRLVNEGICYTVTSAAIYAPRRVTAFCGDGMEYSLPVTAVAKHAPIERRVVHEYASFQ